MIASHAVAVEDDEGHHDGSYYDDRNDDDDDDGIRNTGKSSINAERIGNLSSDEKRVILQYYRRFKLRIASKVAKRRRLRNKSCIIIQKIYRGRLGRIKFSNYRLIRRREKVQERYNSTEGLYQYYFEQNGAAILIQRWIRNMVWRRKRIFRIKYHKFILHRHMEIAERKKRRFEFLKQEALKGGASAIINFLNGINDDDAFLINAVNRMICIVRGFIARRRVYKIRKRLRHIIITQAVVRGYIVRRYLQPNVGLRSRSRLKKTRNWGNPEDLNNIATIVYVSTNMKGIQLLQLPKDFPIHTCTRTSYLYRRRNSASFHNLKIQSNWNWSKMDKAQKRIRRCWKTYRVNMSFKALFDRRYVILIYKIQRWWLTWKRRKLLYQSLQLIQPYWRFKMVRHRRRCIIATIIQTRYRMFAAVKRTRNKRWQRVEGIHRIQGWYWRVVAKRKAHSRTAERRRIHEQLAAGESLYNRTVFMIHISNLWTSAKKVNNLDAPHELQRYFMALSQQQTSLDQSRVLKLARDASLLDMVLDEKALELQYSKAKLPQDKRLSYANFLTLCENLGAIKFLSINPNDIHGVTQEVQDSSHSSSDATATAAAPKRGDKKSNKAAMNVSSSIVAFKYGKLVGRPALCMRLVFTYIVPLSDYSKALASLKGKGALYQANKLLKDKGAVLQRFVRHRLNIKRMQSKKTWRIEEKIKELKNLAAKRIQAAGKGYLGRKFLMRMAQTMYSKYLDAETNSYYWYNPRTKKSFWKKPRLLRNMDCGLPIQLPTDAEQYSIDCKVCIVEPSTCYCDECDEPMCGPCFAKVHRRGVRAKHVSINLTKCIQCDFQAGTKECVQCKDSYCDNCFKYMHTKGRLRLHVYIWQTDQCSTCDERAAKWSLYDDCTGNYGLFCGVCYEFNYGPPLGRTPGLKRVKYLGKDVIEYRSAKLTELAKRQAAEKYALKHAELQNLKKYRHVLLIQRVYRGYRKRLSIAPFIDERRRFMVERKRQDGIRRTLFYQMLLFMGLCPILSTDYTTEKVKKQFPSYMHDIVDVCLDGNWKYACSVYRKYEEYQQNLSKVTTAARISYNMSMKKATREYEQASVQFDEAKAAHDAVRKAYREARAGASKVPTVAQKAKIDRLHEDTEAASKVEAKASEKKKAKEKLLMSAQDDIAKLSPPIQIHTIVDRTRYDGMMMPFTVSAYKGSRIVLTKYATVDESGGAIGNEALTDAEVKHTNTVMTADDAAEIDTKPLGKWKKKLCVGSVIRIDGIAYTVADREEYLRNEEEMNRLQQEEDSKDAADDDSDEDGEEAADTVNTGTVDEQLNHSYQEERAIEFTDDHIFLDRVWVLDDCENLSVTKVAPDVFYKQPLKAAFRWIQRSYPSQKAIAIAAITMHKLSNLNLYIATFYDDDSDSYANSRMQAERYLQYRDRMLKHSLYIVDTTTYDFSYRRKTARVLGRTIKIVGKLCMSLGKLSHKYTKITIDPFDEWDDKPNKQEIKCILEISEYKSIIIGVFNMPLDAPVDVMRLYIKRNFKQELNSNNIGNGFLFYNSKDSHLLPQIEELARYSKDFTPFIIDNKTMEGVNHVTIRPDPDPDKHVAITEVYEDKANKKKK